MNKLEIDGVILQYGTQRVLSGIYLQCQTGSVMGILGRNGCGKSSLLNVLFGSLTAESQSVRLNGQYVSRLYEVTGAVRYLPQQGYLPGNLRVSQAVNLCVSKAEDRQTIYTLDVWETWKSLKVAELSGGERRFLETLLVLLSDAKFVLLDEPFSHLSPVQIERLYPLIGEQSARKGIIITDHIYQHVLNVSSELILLSNGRTQVVQHRDQLTEWNYLPG